MKKRICSITPFNNFFYIDCIYQSIFTVLKYYKRDFMYILANDFFLLKEQNQEKVNYKVECIRQKCIWSLLSSMGIEMRCEERGEHLLSFIKDEINLEHPVIVQVDCFYEYIRTELFGQTHLDHSLLIYGYDESTSVFYVFEHNDKNSLIYREREISMFNLYESMQGYIQNYDRSLFPICMSLFEPCEKFSTLAYPSLKTLHTDSYIKNRKDAIDQPQVIRRYLQRISDFLNHTEEDRLSAIINTVNDIIWSIIVERQKADVLYNQGHLLLLLRELHNKWCNIRLVLLNFLYHGVNLNEKKDFALKQMQDIYDMELQFTSLRDQIVIDQVNQAKIVL